MPSMPFYPLGTLARMALQNGGIGARRLHVLLAMVCRYTLLEPFRIAEHVFFDKAIAHHRLEQDPIFVLGHWRSGTTYLQTLMMHDPRFATATLYRSIFGDVSGVTEPWLKPILNAAARVFRIPHALQRMPLDLDLPGEETVGLCCQMSPYSYTWGHIFPKHYLRWMRRAVLDPDPEFAEGWALDLDRYLRKLSLCSGARRLIVKSPGYTGRMAFLHSRYPNARFVYIHRDPLEVYHSNLYLWGVIRREYALQSVSDEEVDAWVVQLYADLLQAYLEQRDQVPESHWTEVRYETLRADPVAEISRIYSALDLGEPPASLADDLAAQRPYDGPAYDSSDELKARLRDAWAFGFDQWSTTA